MSFNGSGTFVINSTGQPVVTGTVISSSTFNSLTADLGTGLSTTVTKDGQTTTTAKIPFAQGLSAAAASNFAAGTVGLPAIYLSTDTTTGLYRIGANNDGFAVSGAKVLDIASTGLGVTGTLSATGVSSFAAGTVGAPSIYIGSDTTTGLYRIGANNDGFAVSGAKVLDISATGLGVTGTMLVGGLPITPAEGTWTPIDSSGASLSLTSALGKYKKVGSIVWYSFQCAYPATASGANASIGGLPFTSANTGPDNISAAFQTNGSTASSATVNQNSTTLTPQIASTGVGYTNVQLSSLFIRASGFYFTT